MLRAARTLAVLATLVTLASCQTVADPFPAQATLNFDVTDSAVASQRAPLPAPQIVSWRVEELSVSNVAAVSGSYSFLNKGACAYQLNASAPVTFSTACHTSGLTLPPATGIPSASFRITLSRLDVRGAARPDLSASADPDGDGIPNSADNCPIVYNPDQANVNPAQEAIASGDACSNHDTSGSPTIADQDQDGVPDILDNCLWYPSPPPPGQVIPADSDGDGIGDACERIAPVVLPGGRLTVQCDGVSFTTQGSQVSFFRLDFGRTGVLTCDAGFTGCTIDPSALKLGLSGTTTTFACHQVP